MTQQKQKWHWVSARKQGHKPWGRVKTRGTVKRLQTIPFIWMWMCSKENTCKIVKWQQSSTSRLELITQWESSRFFIPEEDYVGSDAQHHSQDAVAHQAEVPPPPLLPLLCRHLLCLRLTKLLPVTRVILGIRAGGKAEGSWSVAIKNQRWGRWLKC